MSFNYLSDIWENSNKKIKEEENYREIFSPAKKFIGKKKYFDFSSNDYLGLRNNKEIIEAGYASALQNGAGAGSSRLVLELDNNISLLEKYFAEKTHFNYAVFFPSGFVANAALFDTLACFSWEEVAKNNIHLFVDHRSHASLFYGLRNSQLIYDFFRHNDYIHLENKLKRSLAKVKIIVVESLYSMDGDYSDPEKLQNLCKKYNAMIIIDETHTLGTYGVNKSWLQSFSYLKPFVLASVTGCGKAVGVSGGFIATDHEVLKERMIQKCKYLIYSTAVSPFITGAVKKSLEIIFSPTGDKLVTLLENNISYFRKKLIEIAVKENEFNLSFFDLSKHASNIFPIIYKNHSDIKKKEQFFIDNGLILKAFRPPTVPKGTSRFRVIIRSDHSKNDINRLIDCLNK